MTMMTSSCNLQPQMSKTEISGAQKWTTTESSKCQTSDQMTAQEIVRCCHTLETSKVVWGRVSATPLLCQHHRPSAGIAHLGSLSCTAPHQTHRQTCAVMMTSASKYVTWWHTVYIYRYIYERCIRLQTKSMPSLWMAVVTSLNVLKASSQVELIEGETMASS